MMSLCSALKWVIKSTTFNLLYILRVVRYQEEYIISDDNICGYVDNLKSRLCCILVLWYISKYHMLFGRYYLICRCYVGTSLFLHSTRPNRMSEGNVCEWYLMLRWWYTLSARFSNHMIQALYMLWCAIWYDVTLYKDCMIWWYGIGLAWYDMIYI